MHFYPELAHSVVEVAHCGVDPEVFAPSPVAAQRRLRSRLGLQRPFYMLVGSRLQLRGYKNCQLFFDAVGKMGDVDFDVLCVGGEPELEPVISELVPKRCHVMWVELNDRDLAAAYTAAIALVFPSRYEGFGLPVIEAMACGCPVITTNLGALPEASGSAAYILGEDSISDMIAALRAVRIAKVRDQLKSAGERQAAKFRWSQLADGIARNLLAIGADASSGEFTEFYSRWAKLRKLQGEVDV